MDYEHHFGGSRKRSRSRKRSNPYTRFIKEYMKKHSCSLRQARIAYRASMKKSRKASRKGSRKSRKGSRKSRKGSRKASRKGSRKSRKVSRRQRGRGGDVAALKAILMQRLYGGFGN
jgi:hypothetical protein